MSEPAAPISGSLEMVLPDGENVSIAVKAATTADVPVLLRAVFGIADEPTEGEPPPDAPDLLAGVWEAVTTVGLPAMVKLWRDPAGT